MTNNTDNTGLASESGVNWEITQEFFEGFILRTEDCFGKHIKMAGIEAMISRFLKDTATSATAFEIETIYHDCDYLTVKVLFINNNEWVIQE